VIVAEPAATPVTCTVAVLEPAGTVTLAVTVATPVLLLDKLTTAPAVFDNITVNVPVALVLTVNGLGMSPIVGWLTAVIITVAGLLGVTPLFTISCTT
jgi:hypothetical protein